VSHHNFTRRGPRAVTLIEMLVTISVVTILFSIVLAVLMRGRGVAERVQCSNNLGQIGKAITMYASDTRGAVPLLNSPAWYEAMYKELGGPINTKGTDEEARCPDRNLRVVFRCPSDDEFAYDNNHVSYGLNCDVRRDNGEIYDARKSSSYSSLSSDDRKPDQYTLPQIARKADFILVADSAGDGHETYRIGNYYIQEAKGDSGSISGASRRTLTDSGKTWTANEWHHHHVTAQDPDESSVWQRRRILRNTPNALAITESWESVPNNGDSYRIPYHMISGRHNGKGNVLFADQHVEAIDCTGLDDISHSKRTIHHWTLPHDSGH